MAIPVPSHGANERLGQFLDTSRIPSAAFPARLDVAIKSVRPVAAVRIVGARIAVRCAVGAAHAGAVFKVKQVFLSCVFHASKHGVEHEQCGQQKLRNGSPR
ncbi:hypothetical protein [Aurantimonas coralicida]|uniref:hypothetical protein n=1 Tax=Aurantimonas coralicida TaxID=182270 RepID=UPI001E4DAF95|nr:hypothetical protein [Aurantimonas coralicida]MCD1645196.1 hypothetical protein [Aurantimonas coralicida]